MPQLDFISYFSQIFWLFIFFSFLYYLNFNVTIPLVSKAFKVRIKKAKLGISRFVTFVSEQKEASFFYSLRLERFLQVSFANNLKVSNFLFFWVKNQIDSPGFLQKFCFYFNFFQRVIKGSGRVV